MNKDKSNVEGILPLIEQQAGLLLFSEGNGHHDLGFLQVGFDLSGELDLDRWRDAWKKVLVRHEALRMTVQPREDKEALVVIWKQLDLPWHTEDLSALTSAEQASRIESYRDEQRDIGLDLSEGPVMRVAIFSLSEERNHVEWTCHHIFLDGWSASIVIGDCLALYSGEDLAPAASYRSFLTHQKSQDLAEVVKHWQGQLSGLEKPLLLGGRKKGIAERSTESSTLKLSAKESADLEAICRAGKFPAGALIRGAWAIALGAISDRSDVAFGSVASGRASGFAGSESVTGFLANTIPVRLTVPDRESATTWFQKIRDDQLRHGAFEGFPLAKILSAGGLNAAPFDHLLIIENLPSAGKAERTLAMENFRSAVTSVYPITLAMIPSGEWEVTAIFEQDAFDRAWIERLLSGFTGLLKEIAARPELPVGDIVAKVSFPTLEVPKRKDEDIGSQHIGPRNRSELELVKWWQDILGIDGIGIHDDFFELGGRSIQALRLFERIKKEMGKTFSPTLLFQNPTVAELSLVVSEGGEGSLFKCLVPITTRGDGPALYAIHAGGGHVLHYKEFAGFLSPEVRTYGLQPVGLQGEDEPLDTIEAMASRYLDEIRASGEKGPYHLLGYCFGTSVVYEMARQLRAAGEEPGLLLFIDSAAPVMRGAEVKSAEFHEKVISAYLARGGGVSGAYKMLRDHLQRKLLSLGRIVFPKFVPGPSALEKVQNACRNAHASYRSLPYEGSVVFLQALTKDRRGSWRLEEWKEIVSEIEVWNIRSQHEMVFETETARQMADMIQPRMVESARAQNERS